MKQKILHVIKSLALGGAETNLRNLVSVFDHDKFEHHVAYAGCGDLKDAFAKIPNVKLYCYWPTAPKMSTFDSFGIIIKLWWYIRSNNISIVHTHNYNGHFWGVFAAKLAGAKVVEHVHDFRYTEPQELIRRRSNNNLNRFIGVFKGLSDTVVVLTKQNHDFLIANKFYQPHRIRLIPNGISLDTKSIKSSFGQIRKKFDMPLDAMVVFTPVRIAPEKNVDLIFKIALKVCQAIPSAIFVIAGNGPLFDSFKARVKEEKLENYIKLVGFQPNINELLAISNVFLLPSFLELHSIAILEAMSMKVPIVVSKDVGCNSEFIRDWENGVLLDPFSNVGWAEAIIKLLKDNKLCATIGSNGYLTCRDKFDIKQTARAFEELYGQLAR